MDDDLILPETEAVIDHSDAPDPHQPQHKKPWLVLSLTCIAFLALVFSLVFIITNQSPQTPTDTSSADATSSFKYDQKEFSDNLDVVDERLLAKDYTSVEYYLKKYSATERMTAAQKYRYYSAYVKLYSVDYLNDSALAQKYSGLADDALKSLREGEE